MSSTPEQNRKYVAASRAKDAAAGIVQVNARVPASRRDELLALCRAWRDEHLRGQHDS